MPDNINNNIVLKFFFVTFLYINVKIKIMTNKAIVVRSIIKGEVNELPPKKNDLTINNMTVELIKAMMIGLTPLTAPLIYLEFENLARTPANNIMTINDGKTTPRVAQKAPKNPACDDPIKVAILIANGPGVTSLTAIKS